MAQIKRYCLIALMTVFVPICSQAQGTGAEMALLRENRRLKAKVDSLERLLEKANIVDELWSSLSGLEEGNGDWGSGVSSFMDAALSEQDRLIAGRLAMIFPEMNILYDESIRKKISSYLTGKNPSLLSSALPGMVFRLNSYRCAWWNPLSASMPSLPSGPPVFGSSCPKRPRAMASGLTEKRTRGFRWRNRRTRLPACLGILKSLWEAGRSR